MSKRRRAWCCCGDVRFILTVVQIMSRKFDNERSGIPNEEKLELGRLVSKYEQLHKEEVEKFKGKTIWDRRRKRHMPILPKWGPVARAVREFYTDLSGLKNCDPVFSRACKVAQRARDDLENIEDQSQNPSKKTTRWRWSKSAGS